MSWKTTNTRSLIVGIFCTFIIMCWGTIAFTQNEQVTKVVINSKAVEFTKNSGHPYIDENGRTMVPLRIAMESAGFTVGFDSIKQTAIVITDNNRIEVPIGTDYLYCNDVKKQNDTFSVIRNGRTYLPIRAVLEAANFTVEWDGKTSTVNAYTFKFDENEFVPYSTSSLNTLVDNILKGNVVYIKGQYYATPEYIKLQLNTQVHYLGDDLNSAVYSNKHLQMMRDVAEQEAVKNFVSLTPGAKVTYTEDISNNKDIETVVREIEEVIDAEVAAGVGGLKEWVSTKDLGSKGVSFGTYPSKGFDGRTSYLMPSLPDDFMKNPVAGIYDGINIKIEKGLIFFYQDDLINHKVLDEPILETISIVH